jgi:hypothetical protein
MKAKAKNKQLLPQGHYPARLSSMNAKPTFRDWALAAIGTMFVLMGLFILPHDLKLGVSTIALFGVAAIMSIGRLVRKLRNARRDISVVQVAGGQRIMASRLKMASVGATCLLLGGVLIVFSTHPPLYITVIYWLIASAGTVLLLMLALGIAPIAHLEFTPAGLVFGFRNWATLLEWDRIISLSAGDIHDNPALFLWLDSPEALQVTPQDKHGKFLKYVRQSRGWLGADIVIMPMQFGIDSQVLFAALKRYTENREARGELAPKAVTDGVLAPSLHRGDAG